jgi:hypothetical protein
LDCLLELGPAFSPLLRHIQPAFLSSDGLCTFFDHLAHPPESVWLSLPFRQLLRPVGFDSLIVSHFPNIFAEFLPMRFSLLWQGSRDGFGARDFHSRCDGDANSLTVILDTNGNVFGGFRPVEWDSPGEHIRKRARSREREAPTKDCSHEKKTLIIHGSSKTVDNYRNEHKICSLTGKAGPRGTLSRLSALSRCEEPLFGHGHAERWNPNHPCAWKGNYFRDGSEMK